MQTVQVVVEKLVNMHCCNASALSCLRADSKPRACISAGCIWQGTPRFTSSNGGPVPQFPSGSRIRKQQDSAKQARQTLQYCTLNRLVHSINTVYHSMLAWALPYWICIDVIRLCRSSGRSVGGSFQTIHKAANRMYGERPARNTSLPARCEASCTWLVCTLTPQGSDYVLSFRRTMA